MRFADIKRRHDIGTLGTREALEETLATLAEQERIRESVPVRSPEPAGVTLSEQIAWQRSRIEKALKLYGPTAPPWIVNERAILASLEKLAREQDDGR